MKRGTKGDQNHKTILDKILREGYFDINPRPRWIDRYPLSEGYTYDDSLGCSIYDINGKTEKMYGFECTAGVVDGNIEVRVPAHTYSINHVMTQYDVGAGECPILTLRPIAWKSAVKEIFWIYQMQSNKLSDLNEMGVHYWNEWDIGDGTIGCRYGETVRKHNLIGKLLEGLKKDPFGRRHIMSMWQEDDFHDETGGTTKGLNPCCYETIWNCRLGRDGSIYLDMLMNQRSSDFATSVSINELQYIALLLMVAKHCGYKPGVFTHMTENVQIYDRHYQAAVTLLDRTPVAGEPRLVLDTEATDFFDIKFEDFRLEGYPVDEIKKKNPQIELQVAV